MRQISRIKIDKVEDLISDREPLVLTTLIENESKGIVPSYESREDTPFDFTEDTTYLGNVQFKERGTGPISLLLGINHRKIRVKLKGDSEEKYFIDNSTGFIFSVEDYLMRENLVITDVQYFKGDAYCGARLDGELYKIKNE